MRQIPCRNGMYFHLFLITSTLTCAAATALANEAVDPFSLSPEQLFSATVISATKTSEKVMDVPAAVFVLTQEDIKRSGATSIPEALRLAPGVQVARFNNNGWAISVRGFNNDLANKLLVLIDGREVYDHLFSGVYWDIQDTVIEDIERIEVIRGPGATLWGSNAVNGVINIITKHARDTQGGMLSAIAGNQEKAVLSGRHGGKMGENGYYRTFAKYLNRDAQHNLSGNALNDKWTARRGGFRADWGEEGEEDIFTLQGDAYESDTNRYRTVPSLNAPYNAIIGEDNQARGGNLQGRWSRQLPSDSRLSMQAYVDYTYRDLQLVEDDRLAFDLDTQWELPSYEAHKLITGARARYLANELQGSNELFFRDADRNDALFSGFVQDKITLVPERWFLTLGSKFEHNDYSGFEAQPNARLQWHPSERQMVWASVARAVRTPTILEHDTNINLATLPPSAAFSVPVNVTLQGNQDFDSEELIAYEMGYRHQWTPSLLFDTAVFFNDYDKLATNTLLPSSLVNNGIDPAYLLLPIAIANGTEARTYGFEMVADWRAHARLNVSATYSYLEMQLDGPPGATAVDAEAAEGYSPQQQFNARAQWDATENTTFDTIIYYTDKLPLLKVEDYWRLDMRWGWRVNDRVEFALVGQNLLSEATQEFVVSPNTMEIGRSIYGNVTWRF